MHFLCLFVSVILALPSEPSLNNNASFGVVSCAVKRCLFLFVWFCFSSRVRRRHIASTIRNGTGQDRYLCLLEIACSCLNFLLRVSQQSCANTLPGCVTLINVEWVASVVSNFSRLRFEKWSQTRLSKRYDNWFVWFEDARVPCSPDRRLKIRPIFEKWAASTSSGKHEIWADGIFAI